MRGIVSKKLIGSLLVLGLRPVLPAAAEPAPVRGVYAEDVNRDAGACTDFYEFANGAWRAKNPIPPAMQRWSRRWASGELAKDQLKAILDEVSAKTSWSPGSVGER